MIGRALRASVAALQSADQSEDPNAAYQKAIAASIVEAKRARAQFADAKQEGQDQKGPDHTADDDDELARAIRESLTQHTKQPASSSSSSAHQVRSIADSGIGSEDDDLYRRAIEESKQQHQGNETSGGDDDELSRAISESQDSHENVQRQKTEEEIVLEYVKKQSLMEEESRQKKQAGA